MYKLKNRIPSIINVIAAAMSIFNNTPHSALKRHSCKPPKKRLLYLSICLTRGRYNKRGAANTSSICKPSACIRCRCVGRPFGQTIKFVLLAPFAWCSAFYTSAKRTAHYFFYCLLRGIKVLSLVALVAREQSIVAFRNKVMDTHLPLPAGSGDKYDVCSAGRSMIEMLGVLAIIAVLSVGGIAGYSKAILMWKSNIQRNMIASLLNSTVNLKMYLPRQTSNGENITHLLSDLGEVPEGVEYKNNNLYSKDGFTSYIYYGLRTLTSREEEHKVYQQNQYTIYFLFYQGGKSFNLTEKEFCNNLLTVSKEFAGEIKDISFWKTDSNTGYGDSGVILYTGNQLKNVSFAEMRQTCEIVFTETGGAHFNISLKYD